MCKLMEEDCLFQERLLTVLVPALRKELQKGTADGLNTALTSDEMLGTAQDEAARFSKGEATATPAAARGRRTLEMCILSFLARDRL